MADFERRPGIRPRPTVARRLDHIARASFPISITVLLMLLTQAPLGIAGQAQLLPATTFCAVWFWSLFRPQAMHPAAVFLIGLLLDLLGYLPIGVSVFTLLAMHGVAVSLRRFLSRHGFAVIWFAFGLAAVAASTLTWLLVMVLGVRLLSPWPALFEGVLAIAVYPVLAIPFAGAHRAIAEANGA